MNRIACIAGLVFLAMAGQVLAQKYPDRPIRLIVPYAPGGSVDTTSRLLAPRFAEVLGQQVVVENRPGANGNIAASAVARAHPDGYTFLYNSSALALSPALYSKNIVDPRKDLMPVNGTAALPLVLEAVFVLYVLPRIRERAWVFPVETSAWAVFALGIFTFIRMTASDFIYFQF